MLSWCLWAGARCSVPARTPRSSARWRGCSLSTCRREQNLQALQLPRNTQLPMATTEFRRNSGMNHERPKSKGFHASDPMQNEYGVLLVGWNKPWRDLRQNNNQKYKDVFKWKVNMAAAKFSCFSLEHDLKDWEHFFQSFYFLLFPFFTISELLFSMFLSYEVVCTLVKKNKLMSHHTEV